MQCLESTSFADVNWWITVIEIPLMTCLFWLIWRTREDLADHKIKVAEDYADHKIKVAEDYAETSDVKILEHRLTSHLLRIEAKLDVTALKTERMSHE